MRLLGEVCKDAAAGACRGGWGVGIGFLGTLALAGIATVATGGAAIPAIIAALPAAGGAAINGAEIGAGLGGLMGTTGYKEEIDKTAGKVAAGLLLGVTGNAVAGNHVDHSA